MSRCCALDRCCVVGISSGGSIAVGYSLADLMNPAGDVSPQSKSAAAVRQQHKRDRHPSAVGGLAECARRWISQQVPKIGSWNQIQVSITPALSLEGILWADLVQGCRCK